MQCLLTSWYQKGPEPEIKSQRSRIKLTFQVTGFRQKHMRKQAEVQTSTEQDQGKISGWRVDRVTDNLPK